MRSVFPTFFRCKAVEAEACNYDVRNGPCQVALLRGQGNQTIFCSELPRDFVGREKVRILVTTIPVVRSHGIFFGLTI